MNREVINELRKRFKRIGDEQISGHQALKILNEVVDELTIPEEVVQAQAYINSFLSDLGFMGSPEYYRQKKIVDDYFEPINKKIKDAEDYRLFLILQSKFENQ